MVDGLVPSGMSDDDVKSYVRARRPDLFGGAPRPDFQGQGNSAIQRDESNARMAGVPGGSPNTPPATPTMAKIAGAGIGAAALGTPGVLPFLGSQVANVAKAVPPLAMMAGINWLRQKVPSIPASAEYLPMFMRFGGKAKPGGAPDATRENVPYAGEEESTLKPGGQPDATKENVPYAGETIETPAEQQARAFGFKQGRLILSPEEARSEDQIQAIAKERASKRGMRYAGGVKPKGTMGQISQ